MTARAEILKHMQTDGYCMIKNALTKNQLDAALEKVRALAALESRLEYQHVPRLNQDQSMVYNLQNKDIFFLQLLFSLTELQALLIACLNDQWYRNIPENEPNYIMRSYLARDSRDALPLHIDSFIPNMGEHQIAVQIAIVLEPMRAENGATIVVPRTHDSGQYAEQSARDKAVAINADAGDILVWDSRLWHGTTANQTESTRWVLIATFTRWWVKQAFDIPASLPKEIYTDLSDSQRAVLGFCSVPYLDERQGIDMKRGYDQLP